MTLQKEFNKLKVKQKNFNFIQCAQKHAQENELFLRLVKT